MSAAIALTGIVALITGCPRQLLCLLVMELVKRFLNTFSYQLLQFSLTASSFSCKNVLGHIPFSFRSPLKTFCEQRCAVQTIFCVKPPSKAYSLAASAFLESGSLCPFLLFTTVFRGSLSNVCLVLSFYQRFWNMYIPFCEIYYTLSFNVTL